MIIMKTKIDRLIIRRRGSGAFSFRIFKVKKSQKIVDKGYIMADNIIVKESQSQRQDPFGRRKR